MRPETAGAVSDGQRLLAAHVLGQFDLEKSLPLPEGYCNHQVIRQFPYLCAELLCCDSEKCYFYTGEIYRRSV